MSSKVKSTSPSCAAARVCKMVLVDPPIAMSNAMALLKASYVAMARGSTESSSSP